jgi:hypothetical protein
VRTITYDQLIAVVMPPEPPVFAAFPQQLGNLL